MPDPTPADAFRLEYDTGVRAQIPAAIAADFEYCVIEALRNQMPDLVNATRVAVLRIEERPRDPQAADAATLDWRVWAQPLDGNDVIQRYPVEFALEFWSSVLPNGKMTTGAILVETYGISGGVKAPLRALVHEERRQFMPPEDRDDGGLPLVREAWFARRGPGRPR